MKFVEKQEIGEVSHFFDKISVAAINLIAELKIGDKISIEKGEEKVEQTVDSMQIDRQEIQEAKAGQEIGLKTAGPVKEGYKVYKITE